METIRNYLENMFLNLPNTPEVYKAKNELWQMMEDKYTELKAEGKSENEAVGIVISEFGNLDELAADLGIASFMHSPQMQPTGKPLSLEDAKAYLKDSARHAYRIGLGVMLCIISCCGPIFFDAIGGTYFHQTDLLDAIGITVMFLLIAIAVGLFIYSGVQINRWEYLKKEPIVTDFATTDYIHHEMEHYKPGYALLLTIGIALCIICAVPAIVLDALFASDPFWSSMSGAFVLVLIAFGVFFIVMASIRFGSYKTLLGLNNGATVGGNYVPSQKKEYKNPTVRAIMSVYWPTVTCIYLCWSFLTFDWELTWIIWPIAAIIHSLIHNLLTE